MNKLFKNIFLAGLVSAGLFACEEEVTLYDGPEFVRFTDNSLTVSENQEGQEFTIPLHVVGGAPSSSIQLSLSTAGNAVEGEDFAFVSSKTPTIEAGEYFTNVTIEVFDNLNATGSKNVRLVINEANGYQIGYGGDSTEYAIGESYLVTIQDDDCPLDIDAYGAATYTAVETGYGEYDSEVSLDADNDDALEVTNMGDWGGWPTYLDFDPDVATSEITVRKTPTGYTLGGETLYWGGTGTYVACEGSFEVDYVLEFDDGTDYTGAHVIYTPE